MCSLYHLPPLCQVWQGGFLPPERIGYGKNQLETEAEQPEALGGGGGDRPDGSEIAAGAFYRVESGWEHYVPVPVLLYARIGKAPAQYRAVVIVDAFRLQVSAQKLHGE